MRAYICKPLERNRRRSYPELQRYPSHFKDKSCLIIFRLGFAVDDGTLFVDSIVEEEAVVPSAEERFGVGGV